MPNRHALAPPEEPPTPAPPASPTWTWREVGMVVILVGITATGLMAASRSLSEALGLPAERRLIAPNVYVVGLGIYLSVIGGIYAFVGRRTGWITLGLCAPDRASLLIVPPLFMVGLMALILVNTAVGLLIGGFENPQIEALTGGTALSPIELGMLLILVAGVAPFAEELFFRGLVYPLMRNRMGAATAIILNAALFAAVHIIPQLLPGLFVIGLFLSYLRERSGSIWPGVMYHAMQNGLAVLLINAALARSSG